MASVRISIIRAKFPGKTDAELAAAYAAEAGYHVIVRYRSGNSREYDNFGCCMSDEELEGYLRSPYCHDAEIVYDRRFKAIRITPDLILGGKCVRCARAANSKSLVLFGGNDFYICPQCGAMFCDGCIVYLPLTGSAGYAKCPYCDVVLKRAIPGTYA
jgi:uncharacterized Zn-finger protein